MLESELQHRRRGVAVVLEERAASAWRMAGSEFTPVSERMLKIWFKFHFGYVSVIAVYAPTNEAGNEEETKKFYQALQDCVRKTPRRDMLLVMGDFNARVGNDADAWRGTIGRFGPEELNQNAGLLCIQQPGSHEYFVPTQALPSADMVSSSRISRIRAHAGLCPSQSLFQV